MRLDADVTGCRASLIQVLADEEGATSRWLARDPGEPGCSSAACEFGAAITVRNRPWCVIHGREAVETQAAEVRPLSAELMRRSAATVLSESRLTQA